MAQRWTVGEERSKRAQLVRLYVRNNRTIGEIAAALRLNPTTIYDRLIRLGIPIQRTQKPHCNNKRTDIKIPTRSSDDLAELIGVLLGDGHLTPTQVTVTLGKKDEYRAHVATLITRVFAVEPKWSTRNGETVIYLGSTAAVRWLRSMGLVYNKVREQVDVLSWIFRRKRYMRHAIRGLFDTDGSVYRIRRGVQLSFCNRSRPLLQSVRSMLIRLDLHPSRISGTNIYLTRKDDLKIFFQEVGFANQKHVRRFQEFTGVTNGRFA